MQVVAIVVHEPRSNAPVPSGLNVNTNAAELPDTGTSLSRITGAPVDRGPVLLAFLRALERLAQQLSTNPFAAPTADDLDRLGLDKKAIAAAVKAGHLLRLADGVVVLPGADAAAATTLSGLPQPFTASQARTALGSSRRVVLPLLAHLDRLGLTRRLPDDRREVAVPG